MLQNNNLLQLSDWRERLMLVPHKLLVVAAFSLLAACATIDGDENEFDVIAGKTNAWQTNHFEINLPLNFVATTNKRSRLVAPGGNEYYSPPFLIIEFGAEQNFDKMIASVNGTIRKLNVDGEMTLIPCYHDCRAAVYEERTEINGAEATVVYRLMQTKSLWFLISYLGQGPIDEDSQFVQELAEQIHNQVM